MPFPPCPSRAVVAPAVVAAAGVLVGCYAIGLYSATLAGLVQFGALTPPLAPSLRAHPAAIGVHALASGTALVLVAAQALPAFRRWASAATHVALGRAYACCVAMGSVSGGVLSMTAVGGIVSTVGFACLAVAWAGTTAAAVAAARSGRLSLHARLMMHSAALAFAAVTLRMYLPLALLGLRSGPGGFAAVYRIIAWLCWVPSAKPHCPMCRRLVSWV